MEQFGCGWQRNVCECEARLRKPAPQEIRGAVHAPAQNALACTDQFQRGARHLIQQGSFATWPTSHGVKSHGRHPFQDDASSQTERTQSTHTNAAQKNSVRIAVSKLAR